MESRNNDVNLRTIAWWRKYLIDILEATYGHTPQWPYVRSRVLKAFGRDGLEGMVLERSRGRGVIDNGADNGKKSYQKN